MLENICGTSSCVCHGTNKVRRVLSDESSRPVDLWLPNEVFEAEPCHVCCKRIALLRNSLPCSTVDTIGTGCTQFKDRKLFSIISIINITRSFATGQVNLLYYFNKQLFLEFFVHSKYFLYLPNI